MGKYMRKAKPANELAVMEVSSQSSFGVRTRAKTLALKGLQKSAAPAGSSGGSYLQLRSRRLELKPLPMAISAGKHRNPSSSAGRATAAEKKRGETAAIAMAKEDEEGGEAYANGEFVVEEASCGDNVLELEGRERGTRESTPCSLIRDPEAIRTPGSTTRPTGLTETNRRTPNPSQRHIPTAHEMDEFFAGAEVEQQKQFMDKYNFDPVNDKPLPGRFKWEKVDSKKTCTV